SAATTSTSTTIVPASTSTTITTSGTTGTTLQRVVQPDASTGIDTYLTSPATPDANWGSLPRAWVGTDEQNAQRPLRPFKLAGAPAGAARPPRPPPRPAPERGGTPPRPALP